MSMGKTGSGFKVYWKIRFVCMRGIKPQAEIWLESDIHIYSSVQYKLITRRNIPQNLYNVVNIMPVHSDTQMTLHWLCVYKFSRTAWTLEHTHAPINLNHLIHILAQDYLCTCTQLQVWIFPILMLSQVCPTYKKLHII